MFANICAATIDIRIDIWYYMHIIIIIYIQYNLHIYIYIYTRVYKYVGYMLNATDIPSYSLSEMLFIAFRWCDFWTGMTVVTNGWCKKNTLGTGNYRCYSFWTVVVVWHSIFRVYLMFFRYPITHPSSYHVYHNLFIELVEILFSNIYIYCMLGISYTHLCLG